MALAPTTYWRGRVDAQLEEHHEKLEQLETRTAVIERFMWKTLGVALVGAMAGGVLSTVTAYLIIGALHPR